MKNLTLLLFTILFLSACKNKGNDTEGDAQTQDTLTNLYGHWVGEFTAETFKNEDLKNNSKINISIKRIDHNLQVTGESIVSGNKRPFKGTVEIVDGTYHFSLQEPGTDKFDGVFEFTIDDKIDGPEKLAGTWTAFNKKLNVTMRSYSLAKKEFKYDAKVMLPENMYADLRSKKVELIKDTITDDSDSIPEADKVPEVEEYQRDTYAMATAAVYQINASTTVLKADDLKNLRKLDLEIIRNTIFARHGYIFKNPKARQFFDDIDWYVPVSNKIDEQLTSIEQQNIKLIKSFENYATNHYDSFGR